MFVQVFDGFYMLTTIPVSAPSFLCHMSMSNFCLEVNYFTLTVYSNLTSDFSCKAVEYLIYILGTLSKIGYISGYRISSLY